MANFGAGTRFASVNLNKSYGHSSNPHSSNNGGGSHYGLGRGRGGVGSGCGMVVLSRPRSSHKPGPKLSVPPPLNLPSLRKEHEKFDSSGSGSGSGSGVGAGGGVGSGARPSSAGLGWSKPSGVVTVKDEVGDGGGGDRPVSSEGMLVADDGGRGGGGNAYMPPGARGDLSAVGVVAAEKANVLRGEDFPSLRATLSVVNGQKQKDVAQQRQRLGTSDESSSASRGASETSSQVAMRPQVHSSQLGGGSSSGVSVRDDHNEGKFRPQEKGGKKDDYFPGLFPLVRLSLRSDWADDERDTSLTDRGRDHGYSITEAYWDRDFDFPRSSFLPHKPAQNHFDRRGQCNNDVSKSLSNEAPNAVGKDVRIPSREGHEGHSWRTPVAKGGFASQDVASDRNSSSSKPIGVNREPIKENKYIPPLSGGSTRDELNNGGFDANRDFVSGRRDQMYGQGGRQQWNNSADPNNGRGIARHQWNNSAVLSNGRGVEKNFHDRYSSESSRYKFDGVQSSMGSRFFAGNKVSGGDNIQSFSRDRRSFSRSEKTYVEDPYLGSSDFDVQDPFSGGILGLVKRKKDTNKQLDFHDPVRESFEAELERVQKMQEQERQRISEEQERFMEMARIEEEERLRVVREQQEHQRRLEEEARETAWRAEQERLEVSRRAEELKVAREEERQRIIMEEERRKQAAKQKLLELEERIARRRTESGNFDNAAAAPGDILPGGVKERDMSKADDFSNWEDGERMVERITNSASSDFSFNRPFDMGSRAVSVRDSSFAFTDRGKSFNSWRRDALCENGNSSSFFSADPDDGHQSPRRDVPIVGRSFPRKDLYGGLGYMPTRGHYRGGISEPHVDDFPPARGHRWNITGDGDAYGRSLKLEPEFHENVADKFDVGWGQDRGHGYSPFPERLYQNGLDEFYGYGRSRHPRQPRVLPPPLLPSAPRASFRSENDHPGSSAYEDSNIHFNHGIQGDSNVDIYQNSQEENSDVLDVREQIDKKGEHELNRRTPGCDSQSSLSVSSPPSSPTQLSHDEFDESRESLAVSGAAEVQDIFLSENEADLLSAKAAKGNTVATASLGSVADDEDWTVENNEESPEQEEYDEDVGYDDEDEMQEGDADNAELIQEFEEMHLEGNVSPDMDNMVLGFDHGVEVGIPNDDCEKSPGIEESLFVGPSRTVDGVIEQKESFVGGIDGQSPKVADATEKVIEDHISEPNDASTLKSTSLDPMDVGDSSSGSALHTQESAPSVLVMNSQSSVPGAPGAQAPAELQVKLQFGLFSGPSLIPSPVPAIQIGSIQMPLQLHPQIGPPLPHMHAPQPPLFQFGQLRYPSPMSRGILPLAPQSMSFVQSNIAPYVSSQVPGVPLSSQPVQDSSSCSPVRNKVPSLTTQILAPHQLSVSQATESKDTGLLVTPSAGSKVPPCQYQADGPSTSGDLVRPEFVQRSDNEELPHNGLRNSKHSLNNRASEGRAQGRSSTSHYATNSKSSGGLAAHQLPGSRGRRFTYSARNPGARLSSSGNEANRSDINVHQRRPQRVTQRYEFRVRQPVDGKQSSASTSLNHPGSDPQSSYDAKGSGKIPKGDSDKDLHSDRPKQTSYSSSDKITTRDNFYSTAEDKLARKEASTIGLDTSQRVEGSLKRNIISEVDVDAPLQSGIVRVYKQPGIESPSDEGDFIEVRSKRQMLNDRRERREKENKAKPSNIRKPQRKSRAGPQGIGTARSTNKIFTSSCVQTTQSMHAAVMSERSLLNTEDLASLTNVVPQPLAPVGTLITSADSQAMTKSQTIKPPQSYSTSGKAVGPDGSGPASDSQSKVDVVHSSLVSWGTSNQPAMALTQTQLEEAMKPACFDAHIVSIGDQTSSVSVPGLPCSSLSGENSCFSATSPVNSLLAGEKIQFGAVTSPTVLPPSTRVVSQVIKPSASSSMDFHMSQIIPSTSGNCNILLEKEKPSNEACRSLEDGEAEAEAAASAVAVAAIGSDDVGSGIGCCSADPKGFNTAAIDGATGDMRVVIQSKPEETLSVSLPADLSVETPPISIWPPLPSPHSSSSQMPSPFPGGPTSHFPYYDMNPVMGGPVFAFGPNDEQSQPQKNSTPTSGPLGAWQECHTSVDSFYGPPAGFAAPFMSPGSMPGVQGPPHMVVYNHFAPVGQYGQVGLSYMGTTYIPSGKQPDWKHNPTSSAKGAGPGDEGEINNLNMVSVQRNTLNVPAQVQHLAPGSPLLSMASPMAMFEMSPFQPSHDVSVNPRWSHDQASYVHTIPQSMPLQKQPEVVVPCPFSHGSANHQSFTANGFPKAETSSSLEDGRPFAVDSSAAVNQFPEEFALVDSPLPVGSPAPIGPDSAALNVGSKSHPRNSLTVASVAESIGNKRNPQTAVNASQKTQTAQPKNAYGQQHYSNYQRGGQKNGSGLEWSNRKVGFHGRNRSSGGERSFAPAKVKQIYVAKQNTSGSSSAA